MQIIGTYSIPVIILVTAIAILLSKNDLFNELIKGCRDGFTTSVKLLPTLIILICAVRMFSASGGLELLCNILSKITEPLGLPKELIPVILTRPISGSAATATIDNLYSQYGPDSFAGRCASVLMGSTDTIIYTLGMYFGAAGIKRTRYALPAAFILFIFSIAVSVTVTKIYFS